MQADSLDRVKGSGVDTASYALNPRRGSGVEAQRGPHSGMLTRCMHWGLRVDMGSYTLDPHHCGGVELRRGPHDGDLRGAYVRFLACKIQPGELKP